MLLVLYMEMGMIQLILRNNWAQYDNNPPRLMHKPDHCEGAKSLPERTPCGERKLEDGEGNRETEYQTSWLYLDVVRLQTSFPPMAYSKHWI